MEKRKVKIFVLFLFLLALVNFAFFYFIGMPLSPVAITGYAVNEAGLVTFLIQGLQPKIIIHSPENITYNFDKGDPYIIALNVSSNFPVEDGNWNYSLYDLRHGVFIEDNTAFIPNSSVVAVRWGNLLTVYAYSEDYGLVNESVIFYVSVPNSDPILGDIDDHVFVCEGSVLSYAFNATDIDEDDLTGDISPKRPFYIRSLNSYNDTMSLFSVISSILEKDDVGDYIETISVQDPSEGVDSTVTNISVIEVNNAPNMEGLGAQTVWLEGDNSTFYHVMNITDLESSSFNFNLTWGSGEDLFDINSSTGVMNYTPFVGHEGQVYSLTVCAEDDALTNVHENISLCASGASEAQSVCDNFTLTVTDENRAPEIVNYTPFFINMTNNLAEDFYVEVYDPDGTVPDIDWYVDGDLIEHNENISSDNYTHTFGCGVSGSYNITIITTDGLLIDSYTWIIDVESPSCAVLGEGGGGSGGGSGSAVCLEDWYCDDWDVCRNTKRLYDAQEMSFDDYNNIKEICRQEGYDNESICGYQTTLCEDVNNCSRDDSLVPRPGEWRVCHFVEDPGCSDGVLNCHDGACELLIDCGGPCAPCATCSDGIQNQGEFGVDCGGPCPYACEPEEPSRAFGWLLWLLLLLLLIIIFYMVFRLLILFCKRRRDEEKEEKKKKKFRWWAFFCKKR
jgi:hypothetical protein